MSAKKKAFKLLLVVMIVSMGAIGAFIYTAKKPTVTVKKFNLSFSSPKEIEALVDIEISNVTFIPLHFLKTEYKALANQSILATGKLVTDRKIASKQKQLISIPLKINLDKIKEMQKNKGKKITVQGKIYIGTKFYQTTIPFSMERNLGQKQKAKCNVVSLTINQDKNKLLHIKAHLEVKGHFGEKISSGNATYTVKIAKKNIAKGNVIVKHQSTQPQVLDVYIPITVALSDFQKIKREKLSASLVLKGKLKLKAAQKNWELPFHFRKSMDFSQKKLQGKVKRCDIGFTENGNLSLNISLLVKSKLPKKLENLKIAYAVFVANNKVIKGKIQAKEIKPGKENLLKIPIIVAHKVLRKIKQKNAGKIVTIKIEGKLLGKLEQRNLNIPFEFSKEIILPAGNIKAKILKCEVKFTKQNHLAIDLHMQLKSQIKKKVKTLNALYHVYIAGKKIVAGKLLTKGITPGKTISIVLPIKVNAKSLRNIKQKNAGKIVAIKIKGKLSATLKNRQLNIPFNVTKKIPIASNSLKGKVLGCKIDIIRKGHFAINLEMELKSQLKKKIKALNASYNIFIAGKKVVAGKLLTKGIEPEKTSKITIPIFINAKSFKEIRQKNAGKIVSIKIVGKLSAKTEKQQRDRSWDIPFQFSKEILLPKKSLSIDIKNLNIVKFSPDKIDAIIKIALKGKALKKIKSLKASYKILVKNQLIAKGGINLTTKSRQGLVSVPISFARAHFKKLKEHRIGESAKALILGKLHVKTNNRDIELPFSITKEIVFRDKPFNIKIKKIRIRKFSLIRGSTYYLILAVTNLTPLKIKKLEIDGKIVIAGGLEIKVLKAISLMPNKTSLVELEVKNKRRAILKLIRTILRSKLTKSKNLFDFKARTEDGAEIVAKSDEDQNVQVVDER